MAAWRAAASRPWRICIPETLPLGVGAFQSCHEQAYVLAKGRRPRVPGRYRCPALGLHRQPACIRPRSHRGLAPIIQR